MPKPTVFLSYSHEDEKWKDELRDQLAVMEELLAVWDDRQIDGGDTWWDKIRAAMDGAEVAVCLISADYLNSDFCKKEEIPYLLKRRSQQGMRLLPVLVRPCPYQYVSWLQAVDLLPKDRRPIAGFTATKRERAFSEIAESIGEGLAGLTGGEEAVRSPVRGAADTESIFRSLPMSPGSFDLDLLGSALASARVETSRLPITGDVLFGRDDELLWLDEIWEAGTVRVVSLAGPVGIGKSTLVNQWLEWVEATHDSQRAPRIFGWSFSTDSVDAFFREALSWFGDPEPRAGAPDRGRRLAGLVAKEPTILVLDDLEALSPDLAALLTELAQSQNRALCILTSREPPALDGLPQDVMARRDLGPLPPTAGRALLRVSGVRGTDAELEAVSQELGGIPAALARRAEV
jgi:TIR domain